MIRYRFEEVKLKATHRWVDADGRKRQKTQTFMQTINPFNKDANGNVKDRAQIVRELDAERLAWLERRRSTTDSR